ncbi:MAG: VWA domain-containing protein [Deltaproteobacteria bacterium]
MARVRSKQNIETDSFDRELFSGLEAESVELRGLIERGANLLPGFRELMLDLFASFYKHNVIFLPETDVKRGSRLRRRILTEVLADKSYAGLREETVLDGFRSSLAAIDLGHKILGWLLSEDGPGEKTLIKEWEAEKAGEELEESREEMETWDEVGDVEGEPGEEFQKVRSKKKSELAREEDDFDTLEQDLESRHEDKSHKLKNMVKNSMDETARRVDDVDEELMSWDASMGAESQKSAGEKLDLASKLYTNEKLRRLSRIVGSLREEMLSGRKKSWSRRGSEVFDIASGDDIGRIIPSELATLSNPVLKTDFRKRLVEGKLLQYSLKEEKGRGPLVICLDGSSSMEGKKELWSKGVCLTLLEIARRERRKLNIVVFSSGGAPLKVFESEAGEGLAGWGMKERDIFELAEYFPGGGTNFEEPLNRALDLLRESKFRRGDIVFITDGEAGVGNAWLENFKSAKEKLGFKVYSVLIDISERESWGTLATFSDKVTSVSRLTSKEAKGIFIDL